MSIWSMRTAVRGALFAALSAATLAVCTPHPASAATCGSNWCSGSDSSTTTNVQGNGPQVYVGEVDTYQHDFRGVNGPCPSGYWASMCFVASGANAATTRYQNGGGLGVEAYYFGGGAGSNNQGVSNYCYGARQGYDATYAMVVHFKPWLAYQYMHFIDIEDPIANYGWNSTQQSGNRDVFNGYADYIAGKNPCGYGANSGDVSQYGVYSAPNAWNNAVGSGIPNTYEWTYETCCSGSWPGASWGGKFQSFGGSSYNWALQFDQSPDYNDAYEPDYLPVLGRTLGN
jgi:hypothetical protein